MSITLNEYNNSCTTGSQKKVKLRKYDRLNHIMNKIVMIDNMKKINIHNYTEYKQNMLRKLDI